MSIGHGNMLKYHVNTMANFQQPVEPYQKTMATCLKSYDNTMVHGKTVVQFKKTF